MAYQFKIKLEGTSKPPVWRKLLVPEHYTFAELHMAIQGAFSWENAHLFRFHDGYGGNIKIGIPYDDGFGEAMDEDAEKIKISSLFVQEKQKLQYQYDFGDSWEHLITLEKIIDEKIMQARCLAGKGACPPEDCGGIWGYYALVEAVNDRTANRPENTEHEDMRDWLGMEEDEDWDVHAFDLDETNARMLAYL
ncbi:hypothetical protein OKW21_001543 [Catalinimonas alkaloidigena]|uniref:plasmid pRiA4b ORF-3 family protein n=1 Tax=Catalinimonas alkaloidigena TaxID=1075417 RepID=UPI002406190E|nr:plasmid pRiA4b ORF-3 family protein [Catalinimonas alkaloidigena]MDF9796280.1 hypothetical protein [Catalinimonas alkaloidigena]